MLYRRNIIWMEFISLVLEILLIGMHLLEYKNMKKTEQQQFLEKNAREWRSGDSLRMIYNYTL